MSITTEKKAELIKDNQQGANDTGSPEVQIAILTERIRNLTEHMQTHKRPFTPWIVENGQRRKLLDYMRVSGRYQDTIKKTVSVVNHIDTEFQKAAPFKVFLLPLNPQHH